MQSKKTHRRQTKHSKQPAYSQSVRLQFVAFFPKSCIMQTRFNMRKINEFGEMWWEQGKNFSQYLFGEKSFFRGEKFIRRGKAD